MPENSVTYVWWGSRTYLPEPEHISCPVLHPPPPLRTSIFFPKMRLPRPLSLLLPLPLTHVCSSSHACGLSIRKKYLHKNSSSISYSDLLFLPRPWVWSSSIFYGKMWPSHFHQWKMFRFVNISVHILGASGWGLLSRLYLGVTSPERTVCEWSVSQAKAKQFFSPSGCTNYSPNCRL